MYIYMINYEQIIYLMSFVHCILDERFIFIMNNCLKNNKKESL